MKIGLLGNYCVYANKQGDAKQKRWIIFSHKTAGKMRLIEVRKALLGLG